MAKKTLVNVDLVQNELQNCRVQNLASAPGSPVSGQIWYNTTSGRFEFRGASTNIDPTARANHTGTQLAATISDFDTQVRTSRLDQMAAPTADVSFNGQKATNLGAPISANDAVRLTDLQAVQNGTDWKVSVRAATTVNITLSGLQTLDGISLTAGQRALVKNQTTGSENGIYLVASGAWTRTADATTGTLSSGAATFVEEGSTQADTQWILSTNDPIVVGTTSLLFTQFGSATTYTGGTGISVVGTVISVDTTVVVRKFSATFGDGSSTSISLTHSLGTKDVTVSVRQVSDDAFVDCEIVSTSTTQTTFSFTVAPALNSLRAVIHG